MLRGFVERVRPGWPGWGRIAAPVEALPPDALGLGALGWLSGILLVAGGTVGLGLLLLGDTTDAMLAAAITLAGAVGVGVTMKRMRWDH